jgi:hypothetical protein
MCCQVAYVDMRLGQLFARKLANARATMGVLPYGRALRLDHMHHFHFLFGQISGRNQEVCPFSPGRAKWKRMFTSVSLACRH